MLYSGARSRGFVEVSFGTAEDRVLLRRYSGGRGARRGPAVSLYRPAGDTGLDPDRERGCPEHSRLQREGGGSARRPAAAAFGGGDRGGPPAPGPEGPGPLDGELRP